MEAARRRHGRTGKQRERKISGQIIACRKMQGHAEMIVGGEIDRDSGRREKPENPMGFRSQFSFSHENPYPFIRGFSRFSQDYHMRIPVEKDMRIILTKLGG